MCEFSPGWLVSKGKFHILNHIVEVVKRFGPGILVSADPFEKFHGVFRNSCIFSNRQAMSTDSSKYFVHLDCIKHIMSGGYWPDDSGVWVQAGKDLLQLFSENDFIRQRFGLNDKSDAPAGS
ncbi:hypothetical protein BOTBODRAFT_103023 [Botryobasidium botryosum FD-172 SS1]|uniref:Uncharacterized protein n=1 Tax=Botryobasidium botryosum (strain FD-172 SS1) TaxID=930990 RepID=A0A067MW00_BOTB1|nr:hypothetical protein BOTBODRAFT_103023 [Botryobasidium botryosum FD-172 SS1]